MHRISILIIDDDEDDFLIVKSLLEEIAKGPLQLDWAPGYAAGEKLLAENRHAICLMDYQLGARDGIELLKHSAELGFTGPIILMTGIHHSEVDILALEAGAVDYLVKNNLTAEQLARSIRYALGRREMEIDRIERLRAEAENRSKSEFLAHLSHELRTPLSAILGFTELLMNSEQTEDNAAHVNVIHRNGKHLLGLLNDILDLSKIEAGKLDLSIQPIQFAPFIADILSLMSAAAMDKNLNLKIVADTPLPLVIYSDPTRLRQVLLNLIGNAIKFTHQGSIQVVVGRVFNQETESKSKIYFNVIDSGIGIRQADINSIFEPFVQIKHSQIQSRIGSGLGLTISRKLVEHLGGEMNVSSQENVGSQFYFSINPGNINTADLQPLNLDIVNELGRGERPRQFSGRILVVDDMRDIRSLIGHFVSRCGLAVEFASNGQEAMDQLMRARESNNDIDLVLMDIHMPVMDGITAAKEIRNSGFICPLIALTAAHMKGDEDLYLKAGFNASLSKPVDQAQLVYLFENYLPDNKHGQDSIGKLEKKSFTENTEQHRESILVVEDSLDALNATKALLEVLGWNPLPASCVKNALEIAAKNHPRIALVDQNLPDGDGYTLSKQLQNIIPDIQVYLVSGAEFEPAKACKAIKGYMLKPVSVQQLHRLLENSKNIANQENHNPDPITKNFF